MATYKSIQDHVKKSSGFFPKNCWIAHMKEICGIPVGRAWNRRGRKRLVPCPPNKQRAIEKAFKHFKMI